MVASTDDLLSGILVDALSFTVPITAGYQCVESFFCVLGSVAGVNHVAQPLFRAFAPVFLLSRVFVFSGVCGGG